MIGELRVLLKSSPADFSDTSILYVSAPLFRLSVLGNLKISLVDVFALATLNEIFLVASVLSTKSSPS